MCGIFWVCGRPKARHEINRGLLAEQQRAQDFAGMTVMRDNGERNTYTGAGHVWEVFKPKKLKALRGQHAIGQIRYPTVSDMTNAQPIDRDWGDGWLALAHNGNFTNTAEINAKMFGNTGFKTGMDTETLVRLIVDSVPSIPGTVEELVAIIDKAQGMLQGSGSVAILTPLGVTVFRDHSGNQPLVYGEHPEGGYIGASEECALTTNGVYQAKEVPSGTIMHFDESGIRSWSLKHGKKPLKKCPFQLAYYMQALGHGYNVPIVDFRMALGRRLAIECPVDKPGLILPIQDSGLNAGRGFAEANPTGILDQTSLIRNKYAGRTFISGTQATRDASVRLKQQADPRKIAGQVVTAIDDSLIRGTTSRHLVSFLFDMGAKEVHLRVAYPIWAHMCFYGIATKKPEELAINVHGSVEGIREFIGATSLGFISHSGFVEVLSQFANPDEFCDACITGKHWHDQAEAA